MAAVRALCDDGLDPVEPGASVEGFIVAVDAEVLDAVSFVAVLLVCFGFDEVWVARVFVLVCLCFVAVAVVCTCLVVLV